MLFPNSTLRYTPVKFFRLHPHPGTPGDITLFLSCPALINQFEPFIVQCPALFSLHFSVPFPFLSHPFFIWPRGCSGEDGGRTIWTAYNDDVITKDSGANFTVKFLLNSKINEKLIKSHLSKIWTWNFENIIYNMGIILQKKKAFFFKSSLFFLCFLLLSSNAK